MSLLKKLAGETAIYGLSSILGRLLNYVIMAPFLTRIFDRTEYGVVGDMYATAAVLMVFFTYRLETAFFRYGKEKQDLNRVFATSSLLILGTTVLLLSILFIFSESIATYLEYPDKGYYFRMFAVILAADAVSSIPFARLRLINKPMVFAAIRVTNIVINILFVLFFLLVCPFFAERGWPMDWIYNPEDRIQYVFLANMIASLSMLVMLLPSYFRLKLVFDADLVKKMLIYAYPLIIAQLAGVVNIQAGIFSIKYFAGGTVDENMIQVGIYNAAVKIPVLMTLFTQAFNYAAEPFFFRNADRSDARQVYGQVGQAFTIVAVIAFLGIMLYMDIIQLILGREFRAGLGIVPIFLIAYLFLGLFYNFSIWYKLADRTLMGGYIAIGGSLITIVLNLILVPIIGIYGPAWAALVCFGFMAGAAYWTGQQNYKIDYPIRKMLLYIAVALAGYFLNDWGRGIWEDATGVILLVNTLIFGACIALFYAIDPVFFNSILQGVKGMLPARFKAKK